MSSESKCPFSGGLKTQTMAAGGQGNRDWWPNQLNLAILHQHSSKSEPDGRDLRLRQGIQDAWTSTP